MAADASAKSVQSRTPLQQLPGQPTAYLARLEWDLQAGRSRPERKRSVTPVGAVVVSRTDPDAALISHGPCQQARLKRKVHMAVDGGRSRIMTAVTAVPASHGDGQVSGTPTSGPRRTHGPGGHPAQSRDRRSLPAQARSGQVEDERPGALHEQVAEPGLGSLAQWPTLRPRLPSLTRPYGTYLYRS